MPLNGKHSPGLVSTLKRKLDVVGMLNHPPLG